MQTAKIFTSGNSQAVRLPKEYRFEEDEVVIKRVGHVVMLFPKRYRASDLMAMLEGLGEMVIERPEQEPAQERDLEP